MRTLIAAGLVVSVAGLLVAQDKRNDPTGTWKVTTTVGDQKREATLKLKLEGDKLTGTYTGGGGGKGGKGGGKATETKIEGGTFKDGEVRFTVTREFQDQKFVTKYVGKMTGDTMKGTAESERGGETQKREFEAKREKIKD
jgi:hypothetical protein